MSKWKKYGQWRHPLAWWQNALYTYLKKHDPAKFNSHPTVIEVNEFNVKYQVENADNIFTLNKKDISDFLNLN